ncbi:MAG: 3-dehydroquinate synthase [Acidobacteriota bacterium]|nr:3-dehydroquinate synthase [Acidobacteriota bacterium]
MPSIPVRTPAAAYTVVIGRDLLSGLYGRLRRVTQGARPRCFVVTSPEIWALWGERLLASFPAEERPGVLFLPPGESHKRMASVERLATELVRSGADRDSVLLAFGGGVIGDVTGFLAAIYMRGIRYVGIPSTLLAQVDSSLGGKTGVNLAAGKNLVGAFHHPVAVYSDVALLGTLPRAELRSGLQEAIKAGIIRDPRLFRYLETNAEAILGGDADALSRVVSASVRVKAEVVAADEKESGLRMILNFGHTLGHAIEAATRYRTLLHGEAVAWGMIAALHLSLERRRISRPEFERMVTLIRRYGSLPAFRARAEALVELTSVDKKRKSGRRAFVLATGIGSTEIVYDVSDAELTVAAEAMLAEVRSRS